MKKVPEDEKRDKHVSAFRISENDDKKLTYWARKDNRTKRGYLQYMVRMLAEVPERQEDYCPPK